MHPDILIKPYRPAARSFRVYLELLFQAFISYVVDLPPVWALCLFCSVNDTELSIPKRAFGHAGIAGLALESSTKLRLIIERPAIDGTTGKSVTAIVRGKITSRPLKTHVA